MCMCGNLMAGIMHACRLHIISPTAAEDCEIKWERVHFCLWIDCVGSILLKTVLIYIYLNYPLAISRFFSFKPPFSSLQFKNIIL